MALKYKIGDRVRIKSLDWYNECKDEFGDVECGDAIMNIKKNHNSVVKLLPYQV